MKVRSLLLRVSYYFFSKLRKAISDDAKRKGYTLQILNYDIHFGETDLP